MTNKIQDFSNSDDLDESWRLELLTALNNLSPTKFELFCRALMKKMNIEVDEEVGVIPVGDGGIDGYGYLTTDDFRTTRVAIQAKNGIQIIWFLRLI